MGSLAKKFYQYQKERFPLAFISITTLSVIFSSFAVLNSQLSWPSTLACYFAVLSYLLHIRLIDDQRDFEHDNLHHNNNALQTGVINLSEIKQLDIFTLVIFFVCSIFLGTKAGLLAIGVAIFTQFASTPMMMGLKKYMLTYNIFNTIQAALLQIFIYYSFSNNIAIASLPFAHLAFVYLSTFNLDILRGSQSPEENHSGKDSYTWRFGFAKSLALGAFFEIIIFILFLFICKFNLLALLGATTTAILLTILWQYRKNYKLFNLLLVGKMANYATLNFLIYFSLR